MLPSRQVNSNFDRSSLAKRWGSIPQPDGRNTNGDFICFETDLKVAKIRMLISAAPFFIWHSILVCESRPYGRRINGGWTEEPLELRAVYMKTGAEAWKIRLRDTVYRGQPPPRTLKVWTMC